MTRAHRIYSSIAPRAVAMLACALIWAPQAADAAPSAPASASQAEWCGGNEAYDWVCRTQGQAFAESVATGNLFLPRRKPVPIGNETTIRVSPLGLAQLTLRHQAHCKLGEDGGTTEVVTRPAALGGLFDQLQGSSNCQFRRKTLTTGIVCEDNYECPAVMQANGRVLSVSSGPATALASSDIPIQRALIVVCAGSVFVRVENENSSAEASGRANAISRYVITIVEEEGVLKIGLKGKFVGPGPCTGGF